MLVLRGQSKRFCAQKSRGTILDFRGFRVLGLWLSVWIKVVFWASIRDFGLLRLCFEFTNGFFKKCSRSEILFVAIVILEVIMNMQEKQVELWRTGGFNDAFRRNIIMAGSG